MTEPIMPPVGGGVLGAPTPKTTAIEMSAAAAPLDSPPVGATVISPAEARELAQWCSEIAAWGLLSEPAPYELNRTAAALKSLAAQVERLQQKRDQLKAKAMGWESHASHVVAHNTAGLGATVTDGSSPTTRVTASRGSALWRMQRERDQLRARVAKLEETLVGIRDANWRHWAESEGSVADDFVEWAKSRARHVLGKVTP